MKDFGSDGTTTVQGIPFCSATAKLPAKTGNRAGGVSAIKTYKPPTIIESVRLGRPLTPKRAVGVKAGGGEVSLMFKGNLLAVFIINTGIYLNRERIGRLIVRFGEIVHIRWSR